MSNVEKYYDQNPQEEWERLEHHRIEFQITLRALAEFLPPPPARLIDIGGGPGRYAISLAQRGYHVTLVDLSGGNLELAKQKAAEAGVKVDAFVHANILELSAFPAADFDWPCCWDRSITCTAYRNVKMHCGRLIACSNRVE